MSLQRFLRSLQTKSDWGHTCERYTVDGDKDVVRNGREPENGSILLTEQEEVVIL